MFADGRLTLGLFVPIEAYRGSNQIMRDVPLFDPVFGDVGQMHDSCGYLGYLAAATRRVALARYILRHPWTGTDECPAAATYRQQLRDRYEREAQTLANLTGWNIGEIRKSMNIASIPVPDEKKWYQRLWSN